MPEDPEDSPSHRGEPADSENIKVELKNVLWLLAAIVLFVAMGQYGVGIFVTIAAFGIPAVLLWFVYWFFLRRLIRIRRIRSAEEKRLLREAALRKRGQ